MELFFSISVELHVLIFEEVFVKDLLHLRLVSKKMLVCVNLPENWRKFIPKRLEEVLKHKGWNECKVAMFNIRMCERVANLLKVPYYSFLSEPSDYYDIQEIAKTILEKSGLAMIDMSLPIWCEIVTTKENGRYFDHLHLSKESTFIYKGDECRISKGDWIQDPAMLTLEGLVSKLEELSENRFFLPTNLRGRRLVDASNTFLNPKRRYYFSDFKECKLNKLVKFGYLDILDGKLEKRLRH